MTGRIIVEDSNMVGAYTLIIETQRLLQREKIIGGHVGLFVRRTLVYLINSHDVKGCRALKVMEKA